MQFLRPTGGASAFSTPRTVSRRLGLRHACRNHSTASPQAGSRAGVRGATSPVRRSLNTAVGVASTSGGNVRSPVSGGRRWARIRRARGAGGGSAPPPPSSRARQDAQIPCVTSRTGWPVRDQIHGVAHLRVVYRHVFTVGPWVAFHQGRDQDIGMGGRTEWRWAGECSARSC
jgi:hypothetical protein